MKLPSKRLVLTQIFLIFILPVALLYFKILPSDWRMILLLICSIFIYGIIRHERWTHVDMGLRHDNFKKAVPFYFVFTLLGVLALVIIQHKLGLQNLNTKEFFIRTWAFFIPVSFFQEFAFRAFLIPRLQYLYNNKVTVILVNAILFTLIHIIYPNLGVGLIVAFVSGIFFAWLYQKYPNLLLVSTSHAVLNLLAVLLGFFNLS
ncbi:MAG TPA: type II CAAX endopeptidase family protein [Candidatus Paceibacterota bacterium]|nr:type II CAAX endopeptidase family protein [Candidatus Paceibacterota bacterium]